MGFLLFYHLCNPFPYIKFILFEIQMVSAFLGWMMTDFHSRLCNFLIYSMVPGSVTWYCKCQINIYWINASLKKEFCFVVWLIFRKITQKNLGGTNYIGGQGEITKTKGEDNILVLANILVLRLLKALKKALNFALENLVNWKIFLFHFFFLPSSEECL